MNLTLFNEHMHVSFSSKGLHLYNVTRPVVKGRVLTCESMLDPKRNMHKNDLTACLSALLPEDECAGEALEGSSLPVRRDTEWGIARVLLPPSSSDPWGVCGRRRRL